MKLVPLLLLLPLLSVMECFEFAGGKEVLIYNKKYPTARLAMFGTGRLDIGTYTGKIYDDQKWYLDSAHATKGGWDCYYIENKYRKRYRIADSRRFLVVYNGAYYQDQTFSFQPQKVGGETYYTIQNCRYDNDRLIKTGAGDRDITVGRMRRGDSRDDKELWKLVIAPKLDQK